MKNKILLLILLFVFNCSTNEFKYIGTTNRISEEYFYGIGFKVNLLKIETSGLDRLKNDLKNALSVSGEKGKVALWQEISLLNTTEKDILIFQIIPDTRVLPEFLDFNFECKSEKITPKFSYYSNITIANTKQGGFQSYPIVFGIGGVNTIYPNYYRSYPQDYDISITTKHVYSFIFYTKKNSCMTQKKERFKAITPVNNIIEFEVN
jgi:hypothetical protein